MTFFCSSLSPPILLPTRKYITHPAILFVYFLYPKLLKTFTEPHHQEQLKPLAVALHTPARPAVAAAGRTAAAADRRLVGAVAVHTAVVVGHIQAARGFVEVVAVAAAAVRMWGCVAVVVAAANVG